MKLGTGISSKLNLPIATVLGIGVLAGGLLVVNPQIDVRGLADGKLVRFGFPKVEFPKVEFPKVEFPKVEFPKVEPPLNDSLNVAQLFSKRVPWRGISGYPEPWTKPINSKAQLKNISLFQSALSNVAHQLLKAPVGSELYLEKGNVSFIYDGGKKSVDASQYFTPDALSYIFSSLGDNSYSLTVTGSGIEAHLSSFVSLDAINTEPILLPKDNKAKKKLPVSGTIFPVPPLS